MLSEVLGAGQGQQSSRDEMAHFTATRRRVLGLRLSPRGLLDLLNAVGGATYVLGVEVLGVWKC